MNVVIFHNAAIVEHIVAARVERRAAHVAVEGGQLRQRAVGQFVQKQIENAAWVAIRVDDQLLAVRMPVPRVILMHAIARHQFADVARRHIYQHHLSGALAQVGPLRVWTPVARRFAPANGRVHDHGAIRTPDTVAQPAIGFLFLCQILLAAAIGPHEEQTIIVASHDPARRYGEIALLRQRCPPQRSHYHHQHQHRQAFVSGHERAPSSASTGLHDSTASHRRTSDFTVSRRSSRRPPGSSRRAHNRQPVSTGTQPRWRIPPAHPAVPGG